MKKLLTFFCVAALLLPVLLTGCGSGGATTVRLNEVTHSVFYAPQYKRQAWASSPTRG